MVISINFYICTPCFQKFTFSEIHAATPRSSKVNGLRMCDDKAVQHIFAMIVNYFRCLSGFRSVVLSRSLNIFYQCSGCRNFFKTVSINFCI